MPVQRPGATIDGVSVAHATARRLTRAEYHKLAQAGILDSERVELIRGIVVEMSPIGPEHAEPVDRLTQWLVGALAGRARVRIQQPLIAADESEPEPDVAVVPAGRYGSRHPDRAYLVIEVAKQSLTYDRTTKAALYAESSVDEYWVVDVEGRVVEVMRDPRDGEYRSLTRLRPGDVATIAAFDDVTVDIAELFA
jgi:Uma2 family endonuclease